MKALERYLCLLITILLYPAMSLGQSVKLPVSIDVESRRLAAVKVEWDGDDLKYTAPPQLDVIREYDPDPKVVRLRVIGYIKGSYELKAIACKGGKLSDFATCVVNVDSPQPGPGPTPPVPPTPDQLTNLVLEAMKYETDPERQKHRESLASLYRQGAGIANNLTITTWGQLFQTMQAASATLGVTGKIPKVQQVISAHLQANLPTDRNRALAAERAKASETFLKVAAALEAAKE